MRYRLAGSYHKSIAQVGRTRAERIHNAVERLIDIFEGGQLTPGLGLKHLGRGLWEIRAGMKDRVIFRRSADTVEFIVAGSHDEIKRYLRII